jgi:hypothetical protein
MRIEESDIEEVHDESLQTSYRNGVYYYDVRHGADEPDVPVSVEPHVGVNYLATIGLNKEIQFDEYDDNFEPEEGTFIKLTESEQQVLSNTILDKIDTN